MNIRLQAPESWSSMSKYLLVGVTTAAALVSFAAAHLTGLQRGAAVPNVIASAKPQDVCPPKWESWAPAEDPPFLFQYRSAAGDRPPSSPYAAHCLLYELRNTPGKLPVKVEWFAQDSKSLLLRAELDECFEKAQERCPAATSGSVPSFSKDFLPSLFRFGSRLPGDKQDTGPAWQRKPEVVASPSSSRFPILPSFARGVVLNADGKVDFRFSFRAYSSAVPVDGGWLITNEIQSVESDSPLPKNVRVGQPLGDIRPDVPVLVWTVPMAAVADRQQLADGARATLRVQQPTVSFETRLEIRSQKDVRFAMTVPAYVDGATAGRGLQPGRGALRGGEVLVVKADD